MYTTLSPPETATKQLSGEAAVLSNGVPVGVLDVPPLKEGGVLAPSAQETTPGRAVRHNEALSSALPLVLVRAGEHGKEMVLPGYYACVGTMPCAATEYYLLVRWEDCEAGRQTEKRVVLPEHIRVLDPEGVPPHAAALTSAGASGLSAALSKDLGRLTSESPASTKGTGQWSHERYPQLHHSSKRKL
jgi:hypothetical protein